MFGLVSRRRYERDMASLRADRERLRGERDQFEKDRDAALAAARTAAEQFTAADDSNARLRGRNASLRARLQEPPIEATPAQMAAWERRAKAADEWTPTPGFDAWLGRPVDGASARPQHPATELLRALERCAALEDALARAEGRRR